MLALRQDGSDLPRARRALLRQLGLGAAQSRQRCCLGLAAGRRRSYVLGRIIRKR